jgi:hypothetical protein
LREAGHDPAGLAVAFEALKAAGDEEEEGERDSLGKRLALPNSEIMIHQVMALAEGQATDIKIRAEHILKVKSKLDKILTKHTAKSLKQIEKDTDRDYYMSPEEAITYGLIDKIVVTDSHPNAVNSDFVTVFSIAKLLSDFLE